MEAVALWNNIAIPVLFALSSASSGTVGDVHRGAVRTRLVACSTAGWPPAPRVHLAVLVLEVVALAAFCACRFPSPWRRESLRLLLDRGGLRRMAPRGRAWRMGVVAPLVVRGRSWRVFGAVVARCLPVDVLCTAWRVDALRFCVVWCGNALSRIGSCASPPCEAIEPRFFAPMRNRSSRPQRDWARRPGAGRGIGPRPQTVESDRERAWRCSR